MKPQIIFGHFVAFCVTAVFHAIIGFGIPAYALYLLGAPDMIAMGAGCLGISGSVIFAHMKIHKWLTVDTDMPHGTLTR